MVTAYEKQLTNERGAALLFNELDQHIFESYFKDNKDYFNYNCIFKYDEDIRRKAISFDFLRDQEDKTLMLYITRAFINSSNEEKISMMIHEMIHLKNLFEGTTDTSRQGRYHNLHFKAAAEKFGLVVEKSENDEGFCLVSLSESQNVSLGFTDIYNIEFINIDTKLKAKVNATRHICPVCNTIVYGKKDLNIICGECRVNFVKN